MRFDNDLRQGNEVGRNFMKHLWRKSESEIFWGWWLHFVATFFADIKRKSTYCFLPVRKILQKNIDFDALLSDACILFLHASLLLEYAPTKQNDQTAAKYSPSLF